MGDTVLNCMSNQGYITNSLQLAAIGITILRGLLNIPAFHQYCQTLLVKDSGPAPPTILLRSHADDRSGLVHSTNLFRSHARAESDPPPTNLFRSPADDRLWARSIAPGGRVLVGRFSGRSPGSFPVRIQDAPVQASCEPSTPSAASCHPCRPWRPSSMLFSHCQED